MSGRALVVVAEGARRRRVALVSDRLDVIWSAGPDPTGSPLEDHRLEAAVTWARAVARHGALDVTGLAWVTSSLARTADPVEALGRRHGLAWSLGRTADSLLEGERLNGAARGVADALVLDGDAPAVALQLGGRAHRGAHGLAGDIAHLGLDRTGPVRCPCGRHGCLGALLAAGAEAPEPPRPVACRAAPSRALGWLAVAGTTLLNVVNPEVLVVSGALVDHPDHLAWFAEAVRAGCLDATRAGLREVARATTDSVLTGTALLFAAAPVVADAR